MVSVRTASVRDEGAGGHGTHEVTSAGHVVVEIGHRVLPGGHCVITGVQTVGNAGH